MRLQWQHEGRLRKHGILGARVGVEDLGCDATVRFRRETKAAPSPFAQIESAGIEARMPRKRVEDQRTLRRDRSLLQQLQLGEKVSEAADRHGRGQDSAGSGKSGVPGCRLLIARTRRGCYEKSATGNQ
jgi:hypothetical protein